MANVCGACGEECCICTWEDAVAYGRVDDTVARKIQELERRIAKLEEQRSGR